MTYSNYHELPISRVFSQIIVETPELMRLAPNQNPTPKHIALANMLTTLNEEIGFRALALATATENNFVIVRQHPRYHDATKIIICSTATLQDPSTKKFAPVVQAAQKISGIFGNKPIHVQFKGFDVTYDGAKTTEEEILRTQRAYDSYWIYFRAQFKKPGLDLGLKYD